MADEQQVYQGGVTVTSEPVDEDVQVYQGGVTVTSEPVDEDVQVYQGGVTVVVLLYRSFVYAYGVSFE